MARESTIPGFSQLRPPILGILSPETPVVPASPSRAQVWTDAPIPVRSGGQWAITVRPVQTRRRMDWTLWFTVCGILHGHRRLLMSRTN